MWIENPLTSVRREKIKTKISIPTLIGIITYGRAKPLTSRENIPPLPSHEAICVHGHYDSQGDWIPGYWIE
jgi:hypothetical protein